MKIASHAFVNALIQLTDLPDENYEVVSCEIYKPGFDVKSMDILLKGENGYVNIEFHKNPLSKSMVERNFEYVVQCYLFYGETIDQRVIVADNSRKSVEKIQIMPDLEYLMKYYLIPDIDGASVLNTIKDKIEINKTLTEYEEFVFSILPFTNHGCDDEEALVDELYHLTPKLNVSEKHREAIALCQFILIDLLIDDEELRNELLDVVAMYESSIEKREKRLIKEAEEKGRNEAEKRREEAEKERDEAEKERDEAEKERDEAEKERDEAKKEKDEMKEILMEVVDNLDEDAKLDQATFKKLLAVTSKF